MSVILDSFVQKPELEQQRRVGGNFFEVGPFNQYIHGGNAVYWQLGSDVFAMRFTKWERPKKHERGISVTGLEVSFLTDTNGELGPFEQIVSASEVTLHFRPNEADARLYDLAALSLLSAGEQQYVELPDAAESYLEVPTLV